MCPAPSKCACGRIALPVKPTRLADGLELEVFYEKRPPFGLHFSMRPVSRKERDVGSPVLPVHTPVFQGMAGNFGRQIFNNRILRLSYKQNNLKSDQPSAFSFQPEKASRLES
jgi:hypothetical protein